MNVEMIGKEYKTLLDVSRAFPDEQSCVAYLEELRWGDTIVSPFDAESKVYKTKRGYKCKNTQKYFNVKTDTLFQDTKLPLQTWFMAIWLVNNMKKGLSTYTLQAQLGITHKTAWHLLHRIRNCYKLPEDAPKLEGTIEIDEAAIGGLNRFRHMDKKVTFKPGRCWDKKSTVLGMIQRGGEVRTFAIIDYPSAKLITPIVLNNVDESAFINLDEWNGYNKVKKLREYGMVNHGKHQYVNGDIHTNTIEGFWKQLKSSIRGIYNWVNPKHLQKYCDETCFRYNTRKLQPCERFDAFFKRMENRLTYNQLIYGQTG